MSRAVSRAQRRAHSVVGVVGVVGALVLGTAAVTAPARASAPATTTAPSQSDCLRYLATTCYSPAQLQAAYGMQPLLQSGLTGKGRTICIVDSFGSPTIREDAEAFSAATGLPKPDLTVVAPAGRIPKYDGSPDRAGWAGETSLDVEWAHAFAPDARLVLALTPTSETEGIHGFPEIAKAVSWTIAHEPCDVLSMSFGATESTFSSKAQLLHLRDAMLKPAVAKGVTLVAASGDSGPTDSTVDMSRLYAHPVNSWPSSDPLVTSVGGTRVRLDGSGKRTGVDSAWGNNPGSDAGGGGLSGVFGRPSWQSRVAHTVGSHRGTPDISMVAAPESAVLTYESFGGGSPWRTEAGTSAATPMFAGIVAVADQVAGGRIGWLNPLLYDSLTNHYNAATNGIIDVTRGSSNVVDHSNADGTITSMKGYAARRGYDLATGLGTIDASRFVPALAKAFQGARAHAQF